MSDREPLVRLVDLEELDGPDREAADSGLAQYGQLLETWRAIMHRPGLFASYLPFLRQVAGPGSLPQGVKEASALLVGHLNQCRYTVSHRSTAALAAGLTAEELVRIVNGEWDDFDEPMRIALQATREVTLDPPGRQYSVEPAVLSEQTRAHLKSRFSDEQIVELVMSISIWNGLARFHRTMEFSLDMPPAPDGVDLTPPRPE
jgi:AhpD family alkylhydroperoxidase